MFRNLAAEMARQNITKVMLADVLNVHYNTILEKMNGNQSFTLKEVAIIKESFFDGLAIEYLFEEIFKKEGRDINGFDKRIK